MGKNVIFFDGSHAAGVRPDAALLGGKGASLVAMCKMGLPVPPGFIIGTDFARSYLEKGRLPNRLYREVKGALARLQESTGKKFGSRRKPLLLAVRSGAPVSMPGMMDTILNIGLNDETVEGLERFSGNPRFAWDSYRRLIAMYGDTVLGVPRTVAEEALAQAREQEGLQYDWELDAEALARVTKAIRSKIAQATGQLFPQDPETQLFSAIEAVFASWNSERAKAYREIHSIGDTGTAVTVQTMVFGNCGGNSGSGVAFTRNPSTGESYFYVEFLYNAQGEDVVSGSRSPDAEDTLEKNDPDLFRQLRQIGHDLEKKFRDMQDIEFTIEDGRLYVLQARSAKRSPQAALKAAVDMVAEELMTKEKALESLRGIRPEQLRRRKLVAPPGVEPAARGLVASVGVASGAVALSSSRAVEMRDEGHSVILVREETQAEDVRGMEASVGLLTARGGRTSHAAVVARQLGLCCIVGCEALGFHSDGTAVLGDQPLREGQYLCLDGDRGLVYTEQIPETSPQECPEMEIVRGWARELGQPLPF
ncbi:MAG: pyruvate, phosphate dikinase [Planctomycetes bacterium]|nr:pyruvate, phosphate dikinase [Planctomycetota bacterium]